MRLSKNERGFNAIVLVILIIIVALIVAVGFLIYRDHHKSTKVVTTTKSVTTPTKGSTKSTTTTGTTSTTTSNSDAGWKSYTLKNEKLSFMYPPQWKVSDTTASTTTQDQVGFTASYGTLYISDGIPNGGTIIQEAASAAVPITYVGQSDYIVFTYGNGNGATRSVQGSDGLINGGILQTGTSDTNGYPLPTDQTAVGPNDTNGAINAKYIMIDYLTSTQVPLNQAQNTQMYKETRLVIQSMHY